MKGAGVLLSIAMSKKERQLVKSQIAKKRKMDHKTLPGPSHYVLDSSTMKKYGYPLHMAGEDAEKRVPEGYVETRASGIVSPFLGSWILFVVLVLIVMCLS